MKYTVDNDLHIHSKLSLCSDDENQTAERILRYAKEKGITTLCLTDHFWDEAVECESPWYSMQGYSHIKKALPLPEADGVRFLFGCETEFDKNLTLGLSRENFDLFDFIVIPVTHFHIDGFVLTDEQAKNTKSRAEAWAYRLDKLLEMDLPFEKIGLAHLTCDLMAKTRGEYLEIIRLLDENEMKRLFEKAAHLGVGIELNACDLMFSEDEAETVLRPYRIAKSCGCKFYMGSDAHHPNELDAAPDLFEKAVELLGLEETDKFII